jgi:nucleoside-diphosphate-sugar epimerase
MRALVTGAGGFLGAALVDRLAARNGAQIRCMVRTPSTAGKIEAIARAYPQTSLECVSGNLLSADDVSRALDQVDVVYHLAAAMKGSPADIFLNTVVGSKRLLEAVAARGTRRVVLVSSFGVYGVAGLRRGALVDESTPLEPHPERRDPYSFAKYRQEALFREYQQRCGFELVILRPGVIYGPGGGHFSTRVGVGLPGLFLHVGGSNLLPLSYVRNCAEAIAFVGDSREAANQVFNVHDDGLVTAARYLSLYRRKVRRIRSVRVPYQVMLAISRLVEWYHHYSKGQLPAIFTPYKSSTLWKGNRFSNQKLKSAGWKQLVPTEKALEETFASFRTETPKAK